MTREIIIDGVNVAGCANLDSLICNCGVICKGRNCYYKQLQRLKQENEMIINEYNKLQAEIIGDMEFKEIMLTGITPLKVLQNLKERNRELQAFYDVHESFKTDFDTNRKLLDNYRSVLEEIRCTVQKGMYSLRKGYSREYQDTLSNIFNKINEVLQ